MYYNTITWSAETTHPINEKFRVMIIIKLESIGGNRSQIHAKLTITSQLLGLRARHSQKHGMKWLLMAISRVKSKVKLYALFFCM